MSDSPRPIFEEVDRVENPINGTIRVTYQVKTSHGGDLWIDYLNQSIKVSRFQFSMTIRR